MNKIKLQRLNWFAGLILTLSLCCGLMLVLHYFLIWLIPSMTNTVANIIVMMVFSLIYLLIAYLFYKNLTQKAITNKGLGVNIEGKQSLSLQPHFIYYKYSTKNGLLSLSHQLHEFLGFPMEDIQANPDLLRKSIHLDDISLVRDAFISLQNGDNYIHEFRIKTNDGKWLWINNRFLSYSKNGDESIIDGIASEITSRKEIERSLVQSQQKYKNLFDYLAIPVVELELSDIKKYIDNLAIKSTNDIIDYLDKHPEEVAHLVSQIKVVDCNLRCLGCFEVDTKEELIAGFPHFFTYETFNLFKQNLVFDGNGKMQLNSVITIKSQKGNSKILSLYLSVVYGHENDLSSVITSFIDITNLKQTETELRKSKNVFQKAFFSNPNPMTLTSLPDGVYVDVNNQFLKSTGYLKEEIVGKHSEEINLWIYPEQRNAIISEIKKFGSVQNKEIDIRTKHGECLNLLWSGDVIILDDKPHLLATTTDITSKIKIERAKKESEEKFKAIVEQSGEMIYLHKTNGNFIEVNNAAIMQSGYSKEELLKMNVADLLLDSGNFGLMQDKWDNWQIDGQVHKIETLHKRKDGSIYPVLISTRKINIGDNQFILSVIRDETEKKEAELAVKKSEEKFRNLFDFSNDAIFILDLEGFVIDLNNRACEMLKYSKDDLINKNIFDLRPEDVMNTAKLSFQKVKAQRGLIFESKFLRSDNHVIDVEISSNLITDKSTYIQSIARDISQRKKDENLLKESENRFRYISSIISDIAYSCIYDGRSGYKINWIMGATESITGYSIEELFELKCWGKIVSKNDFQIFKENILDLKIGKTSHCELRIKHKNGHEIWIESYAECHACEDNPEGSIVYGGLVEISERKKAQQELLFLNKQLLEHNQAKDKLFSIISHDLKSPFNTIIGFSELLNKNIEIYDAKKAKDFAERINFVARQTLSLLDNLLSWAKTQTGQITYFPEMLNLDKIISETLATIYSSASIKNITINYFSGEQIHCTADLNMLKTILRNLISNSIKYCNNGGKIEIFAIKSGEFVEITISDNGIGMNEETIHNLFNIERKISVPGTENEKGSGLGLLICKEFVEKHGGQIKVESVPEKGSKFVFTIPLV